MCVCSQRKCLRFSKKNGLLIFLTTNFLCNLKDALYLADECVSFTSDLKFFNLNVNCRILIFLIGIKKRLL